MSDRFDPLFDPEREKARQLDARALERAFTNGEVFDEDSGELAALQEGDLSIDPSMPAYAEPIEPSMVDDLQGIVNQSSAGRVTAEAIAAAMEDELRGITAPVAPAKPTAGTAWPLQGDPAASASKPPLAAQPASAGRASLPAQPASASRPPIAATPASVARSAGAARQPMSRPITEAKLAIEDLFDGPAASASSSSLRAQAAEPTNMLLPASGSALKVEPIDDEDFEDSVSRLTPEHVFDEIIKPMRLVGTIVARAIEPAEFLVKRT